MQPKMVFMDRAVSPLFREAVSFVSKERNGELIRNHSIEDAWFLYKVIMETAAKHGYPLTIISGRLRTDFYNTLVKELKEVLKQNCEVHVYLTERNAPEDGNCFAAHLREKETENPDLVSLKCIVLPTGARPIRHMVYAGEKGEAFRLELDPDSHAAVASFGNPDKNEGYVGPLVVQEAEETIALINQRMEQERAERASPSDTGA